MKRTSYNELKFAIFYHIFFEDSLDAILDELHPVKIFQPQLLFNICNETPGKENMAVKLRQSFPGCFVVFSSNKGKDIGGKLQLFNLYQILPGKCDLLLFLHDKKSLQALKSNRWRKDLFKIADVDYIPSVLNLFLNHPSCGIVATKEYIIKEEVQDGAIISTNASLMNDLLVKYNIQLQDYFYVAGTMFWVRSKLYEDFFAKYNPLLIRRELEEGNVLDNFSGTYTHSWERLLTWIVTAEGYSIKGI